MKTRRSVAPVRALVISSGAVALLIWSSAQGQLVAVSQIRSVHAHIETTDQFASHTDNASGASANLGPYVDSKSAGFENTFAQASAVASQNSLQTLIQISLKGAVDVSANYPAFTGLGQGAIADAHTNFFMAFNLTKPAKWQLDYFLNQLSGSPAGGIWQLTLKKGTSTVFQDANYNGVFNGTIFSLAAGAYTLQFDLDVQAHTAMPFDNYSFFNGSTGFNFKEACPGDLNGDGQVDDADFVIFAAAYDILLCTDLFMPPGCPADLNGDGFVDDADFVLFSVAYDALLCP